MLGGHVRTEGTEVLVDKLKEMTNGEKITAASGIILLLFSFFTWFKKDFSTKAYGVNIGGTYNGNNGWGGFLSVLGVLLAVALVTVIVLRRTGAVQLPDQLGNLSWTMVYFIAGLASFALILLQVIVGQKVAGVALDRTIFAFLGLLASAGLAVGGFLTAKEAGTLPSSAPTA